MSQTCFWTVRNPAEIVDGVGGRIEDIQRAVESMHDCIAVHERSVRVTEMFEDQTVWEGVVEVFGILENPEAHRCYAWRFSGHGVRRYIAMLETPPVTSARDAVKAAIAGGEQK